MFLSVHNVGVYYAYDKLSRSFVLMSTPVRGVSQVQEPPPNIRLVHKHPLLFAAKGSHALWSSPGKHIDFSLSFVKYFLFWNSYFWGWSISDTLRLTPGCGHSNTNKKACQNGFIIPKCTASQHVCGKQKINFVPIINITRWIQIYSNIITTVIRESNLS